MVLLSFLTSLAIPALSHSFSTPLPAQVLLHQGLELYRLGQLAAATQTWHQAEQAFGQADDRLGQALAQHHLSLAYQHLEQWSAAQAAIATSLELLETIDSQRHDRVYYEIYGKALNTQGRLAWVRGDFALALDQWQQAETYYQRAQDNSGVLLAQINQASALQALGHHRQASQSLVLHGQAQTLLGQAYQALQIETASEIKGLGLLQLGQNLRKMGFLVDRNLNLIAPNPIAPNPMIPVSPRPRTLPGALRVLQEGLAATLDSLPLNSPTIDLQLHSALWLELGNTQTAIANWALGFNRDDRPYCPEGCTQAALTSYAKASRLATTPLQQLQGQLNRLSLHIQAQQFAAIPQQLGQIWPLVSTLSPSHQSLATQLNLTEQLLCLHQLQHQDRACVVRVRRDKQEPKVLGNMGSNLPTLQQIIGLIGRIANQAQTLEDAKLYTDALGQLGRAYEVDGQWSLAQQATIQALQTSELQTTTRNTAPIRYRWEWQLGRILQRQGQLHPSVAAYCSALRTLRSVQRDLLTIDATVQFSFQDEIEPLYVQLIDLMLQTEAGCDPQQNVLAEVTHIVQELQRAELENFLQCELPDLVTVEQTVQKPAAILYPILLPDRIAVISTTFNPQPQYQVHTHFLDDFLDHSQTHNQAQATLDKLRGRLALPDMPEQQILAPAQQLYDWLIKPIEAQIPDQGTLVFVLNRTFNNLPFGVLHDGEHYLIERYSIAVTPGLQLSHRDALGDALEPGDWPALLAGMSQQSPQFPELPPLQNVDRELATLQDLVPHRLLHNSSFTSQSLALEMAHNPKPVVHLATHGQFSSDPDQTFLYAWDQKISVHYLAHLLHRQSPENSGTQATPIELLVLSACETATDDRRASLGIAGMALRSQVHSVVASLWQVEDNFTAQLMQRFYKALNTQAPESTLKSMAPEPAPKPINKAEALRQAQIALMHTYKYRHPHFWASFIVLGDWH
jgi:CHAT domain-containing protein